jgi:hypothetical protein
VEKEPPAADGCCPPKEKAGAEAPPKSEEPPDAPPADTPALVPEPKRPPDAGDAGVCAPEPKRLGNCCCCAPPAAPGAELEKGCCVSCALPPKRPPLEPG